MYEKACDTCSHCDHTEAEYSESCSKYTLFGELERAYMPLVGGCVGYKPTLWTRIKEWAEGWR